MSEYDDARNQVLESLKRLFPNFSRMEPVLEFVVTTTGSLHISQVHSLVLTLSPAGISRDSLPRPDADTDTSQLSPWTEGTPRSRFADQLLTTRFILEHPEIPNFDTFGVVS